MSALKLELAEVVWNYMDLQDTLEKSDVIFAMGSRDIRVAEHGARMWLDGWAPWLVFSGGFGRITKHDWTRTEAETFKDIAVKMGVPPAKIITETESTNCGENIRFTYRTLKAAKIAPSSIILVQKPYTLRRSYATFLKQWPGDVSKIKICFAGPPITLSEAAQRSDAALNGMISYLLDEFERVVDYPSKGFQVVQNIPDHVWTAYYHLCVMLSRPPTSQPGLDTTLS